MQKSQLHKKVLMRVYVQRMTPPYLCGCNMLIFMRILYLTKWWGVVIQTMGLKFYKALLG